MKLYRKNTPLPRGSIFKKVYNEKILAVGKLQVIENLKIFKNNTIKINKKNLNLRLELLKTRERTLHYLSETTLKKKIQLSDEISENKKKNQMDLIFSINYLGKIIEEETVEKMLESLSVMLEETSIEIRDIYNYLDKIK